MTATNATPEDVSRPAPPRRGVARWHAGQLAMATAGVLLAAWFAGTLVDEKAKEFRPTVPQEYGYSGTDARIADGVHMRVATWHATAIVDRTDGIYSLVHQYLASEGVEQDFTAARAAEARVERWRGAAWIVRLAALSLAVVWWWRWFGSRA